MINDTIKFNRRIMKELIIRNINEKDYYDVEYLTKRAFWNINMPGCDEHYFVHRIWSDEAYIPEISFLAELNGEIVGAILYTKSRVETDNGSVDTLTFGPLCVEPKLQREGIGGLLLKASMDKARECGHKAIFICGVPEYYPRHGFVTADKLGVSMPDGSNFDAFMGIELEEGSLKGVKGKFYEADVCICDIHDEAYMKEVEEFDKKFPYMEKLILPGQWR